MVHATLHICLILPEFKQKIMNRLCLHSKLHDDYFSPVLNQMVSNLDVIQSIRTQIPKHSPRSKLVSGNWINFLFTINKYQTVFSYNFNLFGFFPPVLVAVQKNFNFNFFFLCFFFIFIAVWVSTNKTETIERYFWVY